MCSLLLTFQSHEGRRLPVLLDEGGINMAKVQDMPKEMEKHPSPGRSTLHKVASIALLGSSLAYFALLLQALLKTHHLIPPILILGTLTLLGTALSFLRLRWAPALGAVVALGVDTFTMSIPPPQYIITHPSDAASFITLLLILSFGLVGIVAGIAATVEDYRSPGAPAPRNLRLLLTSFTTFVVGMIVASLIVAANPPTSAASTTTNGEPTVHLSVGNFVQNVVLVPKGSKLHLVEDVNTEHVLRNGFWKADGTPESSAEPGAPVVNVTVTGGSVDLGPFVTAGVFHLYCTIHPGMNLTIVVQ
jgi:plastocyanin